MANYSSLMDLIRALGLFPIPFHLSISNLVKGYLMFYIIFQFFKYNFFISDIILNIFDIFLPNPISVTIRLVITQAFWTCIVFVINKRKIKITISGVDFKDAQTTEKLKNCIVVSNHKSLFDYILINYLKNMVQRATNEEIGLNFFTWNYFWELPGVQLLYQILSNDENWEMEFTKVDENLRSISQINKNNWIVHFPEVNLFTDRNRLILNQQSEKFYTPKLNQLLYPRFLNFNHLITSSQLDESTSTSRFLLDLSIIYFNPIKNIFECPTIFEILTLKQPIFMVHVDFKLKSINKLPYKSRKLEKWLENNWCEKDIILETIQKQLKINE